MNGVVLTSLCVHTYLFFPLVRGAVVWWKKHGLSRSSGVRKSCMCMCVCSYLFFVPSEKLNKGTLCRATYSRCNQCFCTTGIYSEWDLSVYRFKYEMLPTSFGQDYVDRDPEEYVKTCLTGSLNNRMFRRYPAQTFRLLDV